MLVGKGVQTFEKKEKSDTKSTAYTGGIYGLNHDNFASKTHSKVLSSSSRSLCCVLNEIMQVILVHTFTAILKTKNNKLSDFKPYLQELIR